MKIFSNIYIKNLFVATIIFLVLVFTVLWWLNIYTRHGSQVMIPDVKGMQVAEAAPFFAKKGLNYEVIDSTFVRNKAPGSILETIPPVGTNVKEGRTIYLTVNSRTAQMLIVPVVKDMSQRQAQAILKSVGFETVTTQHVPGAFRDLVVGLETRGRALNSGERLPADTPLTLLVNSGVAVIEEEDIFFDSSNPNLDSTPEESWF